MVRTRPSGGSGGSSSDDDTINLADELEEAREEDTDSGSSSSDTATGSSTDTELVNGPTGGGSDPDPAPDPEPDPEPDPAPPSDSTGGAVSPSDPVEDAAENADPEPDPAPPSDSTGGAVSPDDDTESAADDYSDENRRPPEDTTGGPAAPSDEVEDAAEASDPQVSPPDPAPADGAGPTDADRGTADDRGPLDRFVDDRLDPAAETYDERIAEGAGEFIRDTSPATLVDSQIPGGNPVGRAVENSVRGAVNIGNVPGIAAGAIQAGQRAADDTARVNEQGAAGRRQNRQELAGDAVGAVTATGQAIQDDPVGTISRLAGGTAAGFGVGGAASRASRVVRGSPDVDGAGSGAAVRTGRSDVGTGGVDTILDADTVDSIRGTSGPSRRSRLRGEASRRLDDLDEMLPGGSDRGQLQAGGQGRGTGRDGGGSGGETPAAPRDFDGGRDPTRPPDAGGSFEDVRDDALTQLQDDLGSRGQRPDAGDFEPSPDALAGPGTRRGTITESGDVELTRSSGGIATESAGASGAGATSRFSSTGGGAAGVGSLSGVNDPTGVSETGSPTGGTTLDPQRILGGGTDTTGAETLSETNDATGIDPGTRDQFGGPLGGGTLPGDAQGGGSDTGTLDETNDPTDVAPPDATTDTRTDVFSGPGSDAGTGTGPGSGTAPGSDTDQPPASDTDQPPATDTPAPPVVDVPPVTDTPAPPTNRPPTRPPAFPPARPPAPRRPRRSSESEEEPDRQRQRDTEPEPEFRLFGTADDGGPAVGFGAETFAALATGPFGEREVAEGSTDEFYAGELPAASFLDPADDDEEEGVAFVSGLFGLGLGGGGR